ncbi:MAG: hypothetical protein ACI9H6_000270 [Patiriisocius sp.]|jgi:hypothetical protein
MSKAKKLYQKHLAELQSNPLRTQEIHAPGPSLAQFVEGVAGMGERARQNGTMARMVRNRKRE